MKKKSLIIFGFLLALGAIFFNQQSNKDQITSEDTLQQQDSWQAFNSKTWRINQDQPAKTQRILTASFMQESGDFVYLTQPFIEMLDPDKLITLSSKTGKVFQHDLFDFYQQVELNQYIPEQTASRLLETEHLKFNQSANLASSDLAVKISSEQQITTAVGMQYDLESRLLDLFSEVETFYEPKNQNPNP